MLFPYSGAILRGSPSTGKLYAGKYGELTPLRQRGRGGYDLPFTHLPVKEHYPKLHYIGKVLLKIK
jgi:hypothetical protein